MFEAKLLQGGFFKKVLDAIKDLISTANFDCTSAGFGLHAMDPSHVALVCLQLRHDAFEEFRCDKNRHLGMSVASLAKVLKCCDNNDTVTIQAEENREKISFTIESAEVRKMAKFQLSLLDIDMERLSVPDAQYFARVTMPSGEFGRIIRDLSTISESICISVTKSGISFSAEGDIGTAEIICAPYKSTDQESEAVSIEMTEPVIQSFAAKYLNSFTKATPLAEKVLLCLAPGRPLSVEYHIDDMGYLLYYLAPKIDDEDMDDAE